MITLIEIHDGEVQFTTSSANNLQRSANTSGDENHGSRSPKGFTQHAVELTIARVEENKPWFHRDLSH
jgi:hypothetical protein